MKISKIIFLLILSFSLFNSSIAMEADSSDEARYNGDSGSASDTGFEKNYDTKIGFKLFTELPPELQFMILYLDLTSVQVSREIRRRASTLFLVCKLVKNHTAEFKREKIWQKLLAAERYVKGKKPDEIVQELIDAATANDIEHVRFLILGDADLIKDNFGNTALFVAASMGYKGIVNILIAADANLNAKNNSGDALIWAACRGHTEIVKILTAAGADLNAKNNSGNTASIFAAYKGHTEIEEILKAAESRSKIQWCVLI